MKIKHILNEAMIKVPDKLTLSLMEVLYAYIISYFVNVKDKKESDALIALDYIHHTPRIEKLFQRIKFKFADILIYKFNLKLDEYDVFKNLQNKKIVVQLKDLSNMHEYCVYNPTEHDIIINMHYLKMLLANQDINEKHLEIMIEHYHSDIEKALTHFITATLNVSRNKSNDEFMSHLREVMNKFNHKLEFLRKSIFVNDNDAFQLFRYYLGDQGARIQRFTDFLEDFHSAFMLNLKEDNQEQWKKAVKLLIIEYRKQHEKTNK